MISLHDTVGNTTIELPDDLFWSDEITWSPVSAQHTRTLQGSLIIDEFVATAGRPITLEGSADMGWVTRQTVLALMAWRDIAGRTFTLTTKDNRTFTVKFDQTTESVKATPVMSWKQTDNADWYQITLKFVEV